MTWFEDLSPCKYFPLEMTGQLLAVGWLERDHVYNKGPVREEVVDTLLRLLVDPWQPVMTWGWHICSLCPLSHFPPTLTYKGKRIAMGISNVFVPGDQCIYVAPSMIAHYMSVHEYAPPQAFCQALLACPPMHSTHYFQAILSHGLSLK